MAHVFVSYVRQDQSIVDRLCEHLRARGVEVWLDRESIRPGERWKDAIREAIRSGDYFIACFSKNAQARAKTYMNEELTLAVEELRQYATHRSWFIPILLDECDVPAVSIGAGATLIDLQFVSLFPDEQKAIQRICDVIKPIDPVEVQWQKIVISLFLRGPKTTCSICGIRWGLDNLSLCSSCGAAYCYKCVWELPEIWPDGFRTWRCGCGGDTRIMSDTEWCSGYDAWKKKRNGNQDCS